MFSKYESFEFTDTLVFKDINVATSTTTITKFPMNMLTKYYSPFTKPATLIGMGLSNPEDSKHEVSFLEALHTKNLIAQKTIKIWVDNDGKNLNLNLGCAINSINNNKKPNGESGVNPSAFKSSVLDLPIYRVDGRRLWTLELDSLFYGKN